MIDRISDALPEAMSTPTIQPKGLIRLYLRPWKTGARVIRWGGSRFSFFVIELTNATVQDMTIGANDAVSEEVSFTFQRIKLTDIIMGANGKFGGTVVIDCDFKALKCT